MPYRISFTDEAERSIPRLPGFYRQRIRRLITGLGGNPRPGNAKPLREGLNRYRIVIDGWRVIYQVHEESQTVVIVAIRLKVGPETYENLDWEF